jgi:hypothetical protein
MSHFTRAQLRLLFKQALADAVQAPSREPDEVWIEQVEKKLLVQSLRCRGYLPPTKRRSRNTRLSLLLGPKSSTAR